MSIAKKRMDKPLTASIRANVLDKIEIRTGMCGQRAIVAHQGDYTLVRRRVLDNAANMVMRIGPKMGWKLSA